MNKIINNKKIFSLLFLLTFIFFFIERVFVILSIRTDIAGVEQNIIYSIQTLLNGGNLYSSPKSIPFSITQYTPIYYYICAFTAKIFSKNNNYDIQVLYEIARIWSLIFNLISSILVFKIAKNIFKIAHYKSYIIFILSFTLTLSPDHAARPDSIFEMFGIASVFVFLKYLSNNKIVVKSNILLTLSVILTAFSVFSKQSGIQYIIIFVGYSLLIKDFKTTFKLLGLIILSYIPLFLLFSNIYPAFLENVIGGVANGISIEGYFHFVLGEKRFILSSYPLIILCIIVYKKHDFEFSTDNKFNFLGLSVLGTFIFANVTGLKMGSSASYFWGFTNLSLIFIFKEFNNVSLNLKEPSRSLSYINKLLLIAYYSLVIVVFGIYNYIKLIKVNNIEIFQKKSTTEVAKFIENDRNQKDSNYIYANLARDYNWPSRQNINNLLFKFCLVPQLDVLEWSTQQSKVMGYKNFENLIMNGKVEYIIESNPRTPFKIINNLESIEKDKYKIVKRIDGYIIYKLNQ